MTTFDLANGGAVAIAIACAFGVPKHQRQAAVFLIGFVTLNWLFYISSYWERGPLAPLWDAKIDIRYDDAWALFDAFTATFSVVCGVMTRAWWFAAVYLLALSQVAFHVLYWSFGYIPKSFYYNGLDVLFWGILTAFICAGGRGVQDYLIGLSGVRWLGQFARKALAIVVARS